MKIENIQVTGFEAAFRGMRNPMNSWAKSTPEADLELAHKLAKAGPVHGKFRRMIIVTMDITAPLYWWKEFDTYKVGTVANSCSTMHTLMNKPFELEDFETDNVRNHELIKVAENLNRFRNDYLDARQRGDEYFAKQIWYTIVGLLPSAYLQKRTIMLNYEVLSHIFKDRQGHKLKEWKIFLDAITTLPHANELILADAFETKKSTAATNKVDVELNDNLKNFKPVDFDANMFTPAKKFNPKKHTYQCIKICNEKPVEWSDNFIAPFNKLTEAAEDIIDSIKFITPNLTVVQSGETIKFERDPINPSHYKDSTSIECIEAMLVAFGGDAVADFCICNAYKYLWRHEHKNGKEDLEKALWYIEKAKDIESEDDTAFVDMDKVCDIERLVKKYLEKYEKETDIYEKD